MLFKVRVDHLEVFIGSHLQALTYISVTKMLAKLACCNDLERKWRGETTYVVIR